MSYLGRSAKLSLKAQEKVSFLATAGQTVKTGLSYTAWDSLKSTSMAYY